MEFKKDNDNWIHRVRKHHENRGYKVVRIIGNGHVLSERKLPDEEIERQYDLHVTFIVKKGEHLYQEEQTRRFQASVFQNRVHSNIELAEEKRVYIEDRSNRIIELTPDDHLERFSYDRKAAVRYAEIWWNDANPTYQFFEGNDCTNYISQCLRAGGAPYRGYPNRSTGWWYQDDDWSFSWSVSHGFRWYLSGSTKGLRATEVDVPEKLSLGDVICYDFAGDGRFDHVTIVVAKNNDRMPLVNAHTNNSRHRYWDYQDSLAWTPDCQYKFFRINDGVL